MLSLRSNRIVLVGFATLVLTTLYFFYPTDHFRSPRSPVDPYNTYEAGGIDSEHYQEPVRPKFETDLTRKEENCDDGICDVNGGVKGGGDGKKQPQKPALGTVKSSLVIEDKLLNGGVIMPKLTNETAKAELGRAAWRVLHLMTLRYPETPTEDERTTLKSFFQLFSRLYPCGECAEEFQTLLKQYPPQTSSRKTASMWLCSVHNMINERLGKPEFDCLTLNDVYDCGCGPEGEDGKEPKAGKSVEKIADVKDKVVKAKEEVKEKITESKEKGKEVIKEVKEKAGDIGSKVQGVAAAAVAKVAEVEKKVANPIPTDKEEVIYRPKKAVDQAVEVAKKAKEAAIPKPVPSIKEEIPQAVVKPIPIELSDEDEEAEEDDSGLLDSREKDGLPPAEKEI